MGLKQVDMSKCTAKCKCLTGPNVGQLYNVEEPCPYGYEFNAENCDCPQPCDWCPDLTANPDIFPEKAIGRCARIGPEGENVRVSGFAVDVVGSCDSYYGFGSLLSNGCGTKRAGSRVEWRARFGTFKNAYFGGCPPRQDGSDRCRNFQLYFGPYDTPCARGATSGPAGGLVGVLPGRQELAVDPYWQPGAFNQMWLVDGSLTPDNEEYWLQRLLYNPALSVVGNFNGDVGYYIGQYSIEIRCTYSGF